ncbi:hypothetical protein M8C21_030535, partial [Ambrosia artemisiifolia]
RSKQVATIVTNTGAAPSFLFIGFFYTRSVIRIRRVMRYPRRKNNTVSDLPDRFAKIRLSPPRSPKISSEKDDTVSTTSGSESPGAAASQLKCSNVVTEGIPPPLPLLVYLKIKEAADIMNRPGWRNGGEDEFDLEIAEYKIGLATKAFRSDLPNGWK